MKKTIQQPNIERKDWLKNGQPMAHHQRTSITASFPLILKKWAEEDDFTSNEGSISQCPWLAKLHQEILSDFKLSTTGSS